MIVCLLNNESRLSAECQTSVRAHQWLKLHFIRGNTVLGELEIIVARILK